MNHTVITAGQVANMPTTFNSARAARRYGKVRGKAHVARCAHLEPQQKIVALKKHIKNAKMLLRVTPGNVGYTQPYYNALLHTLGNALHAVVETYPKYNQYAGNPFTGTTWLQRRFINPKKLPLLTQARHILLLAKATLNAHPAATAYYGNAKKQVRGMVAYAKAM